MFFLHCEKNSDPIFNRPLDLAKNKWYTHNIRHYYLVQTRLCFYAFRGQVLLEVRDGTITFLLDPDTHEPLQDLIPLFKRVEPLFQWVKELQQIERRTVKVT